MTAADRVDYPALERSVQKWWGEHGVIQRYLHRNDQSEKQFSFLDGPITANNPMGVHHAWGRTYKDIYQRYHTMRGYKQRYQNGFDTSAISKPLASLNSWRGARSAFSNSQSA